MAKSCFLGRKEIQFRQSRWFSEVLVRQNFPDENFSTGHSGGGSLRIWGDPKRSSSTMACWEILFWSSRKPKLQFVSGRQKAADYVKMLNDLSFEQ